MTVATSLLTMQPILLQGLSQFQSADVRPANAFVDEPTLVEIQIPVRPDPSNLSSDIVQELLSYAKLRTDPEEIVRLSRWMNEKRLGVCFFTKAVEFLVEMRREERASEEETTKIRRRPSGRIA